MSTESSSQFAPPLTAAVKNYTAIISPQFCSPIPTEFTFFTKASWLKSGRLGVTDGVGRIVFEVENHTWNLRNRQVLFDAAGRPVISMQRKLLSPHHRWRVFNGEGSDPRDLLFSVKRSSACQVLGTELEVFLAGNDSEEVCDFRISGSYRKKSCTVYKGSDRSTVIAQMSREWEFAGNGSESKHVFRVSVGPSVDCCLITALVVVARRLCKETEIGLGIAIPVTVGVGVCAGVLALI